MNSRRPVVAVTPGEPAGIGPELLLAAARETFDADIVAVADMAMLAERADQLGIDVDIVPGDDLLPEPRPGQLVVQHVPLEVASKCGRPDPRNAAYVIGCLELATRNCVAHTWQAMVTGPVHKAVINDAGIPFTGHTEYLARLTGTDTPVMMLATEELRVALVTTHLPLSQVPAAITGPRLDSTLRVLHQDLRGRFGIASPRIIVCGLNPHAGEGGHLGREEIEVIAPALARARSAGIDARGPFPADTAFNPDVLAGADVVLAMYHDQGLPVLKHTGFGRAVNVTLGLPIVRTSVDHGTALDLSGTGKADAGSLIAAIAMASRMAGPNRH
jgi:4-hydroxythreonine-4-phosphate dehydrogenase